MKDQYRDKDASYEEEDFFNASSATDCTGLIPSAPENTDEVENYEEIYHFLPQAAKKKEKPADH